MKPSVTKFDPARCLRSHILYRCDLQRSDSVNIHLGVLIELVGPDWHSLGVAVRTGLAPSESDALALAWRDRLSDPFKFFEPYFENAWKRAPTGECIDWLAAEFGSSLLVEPASELPRQRVIHQDGCATEEYVRTHVFSMLDSEAKLFLKRPPAVLIESEPAAAAA